MRLKRFNFLLFIAALSCTKDKQPEAGANNKVTLGPTVQVTSITVNSAATGGNVLTMGVDEVLERGVCWNTSGKPTVGGSKTVNGKGTGSYTSNLTNLSPGTRYFVRSYATTQTETIYGSELNFTTLLCPTVTTGAVSGITGTTAIGSGNLSSNGGQTVLERGFVFHTSTNPTVSNGKAIAAGTALGAYTAQISGLSPNTVYYVRSYVTTSACSVTYGNEVNFRTVATPTLTTNSVSNIGLSGATSGGNITNDGGSAITERGVCWNVNPGPTTANARTVDGSGSGSFISSIGGLAQNTTYYVRSYASNAAGTGYGNELVFKTNGLPIVSTVLAASITSTSAVSGGNVSSDGGLPVSSRGVCWSTSPGPTTSSSRTTDGSGTGAFTSSLSGLTPNTRYYYRAYAVHSQGTGYGTESSFITGFTLPTVSTASVTSITTNSAVGGGQVTSDGGAPVTQRGICWNLTGGPQTSDSRTIDGSGTGSFSSSMNGLLSNRTYYVRAYATNSAGTVYGTQVSFNTQSIVAPTVSTSAAGSVTSSSISIGGNVTSSGGGNVSARGVCWNTTGNPTIANTRTSNGSGTGSFTSDMTGLTPNTLYYIRAYATNENSTAYGNQVAVTTLPLSLSSPTLSSPLSSAIVGCCSVNFSWLVVSGAAGYEIQISRSSTFSGTVFTSSSIDCGGGGVPQTTGVNSRTLTSNTYCMRTGTSGQNGVWYWRVRAYNGSLFSNWSTTRSYTYQF